MLASDQLIEDSEPLESSTSASDAEEQSAHILLSDHLFDAYYYSEEEERPTILAEDIQNPEYCREKIKLAEQLLGNFEYQEGLNICLRALEADYDNIEAHRLILETFNSLGFRNQLTLKTKEALKEIMLKSKI